MRKNDTYQNPKSHLQKMELGTWEELCFIAKKNKVSVTKLINNYCNKGLEADKKYKK